MGSKIIQPGQQGVIIEEDGKGKWIVFLIFIVVFVGGFLFYNEYSETRRAEAYAVQDRGYVDNSIFTDNSVIDNSVENINETIVNSYRKASTELQYNLSDFSQEEMINCSTGLRNEGLSILNFGRCGEYFAAEKEYLEKTGTLENIIQWYKDSGLPNPFGD